MSKFAEYKTRPMRLFLACCCLITAAPFLAAADKEQPAPSDAAPVASISVQAYVGSIASEMDALLPWVDSDDKAAERYDELEATYLGLIEDLGDDYLEASETSDGAGFVELDSLPATRSASLSTTGVVISQIFGGGGNSQSPYRRDYIELYNAGPITVSLVGWSVQYQAAGSTGVWTGITPLAGSIDPGEYFLVGEEILPAATLVDGQTAQVPAVDVSGAIAMSGTTGKVALVKDSILGLTTPAAPTCPPTVPVGGIIEDFVGYGTTANCREPFVGGAVANNTPAPDNTLAIFRVICGVGDTDNNVVDWVTGFPSPRNSATPANLGLSGIGHASPMYAEELQTTRLQVTPGLCSTSGLPAGTTVTADLTSIGGALAQALNDAGADGDEQAGDGIYSYAATIAAGTVAGTKILPVTYLDGGSSGGSYIGLEVRPAATPNNDNCATAIAIPGPYSPPVSTPLDTLVGSTVEYNPINSFSGPGALAMSSRRGVWYTVTGTGNTITADTCGSPLVAGLAPNTVIAVLCGTCDGLTEITSNDQAAALSCGGFAGTENRSRISWCSEAGTTYYVWVGSNTTTTSTALFDIVTTVSDNITPCCGAAVCTTCTRSCPSGSTEELEAGYGPATNDGCDRNPTRFTELGLVGATPVDVCGTARGYSNTRDVDWYRLEATSTGTLTASITAQFAGAVSIHLLGAGGVCTGVTTIGASVSSQRCGPTSASAAVTAGSFYAVRVIHAPTPTQFGGLTVSAFSNNYFGSLSITPNGACCSPSGTCSVQTAAVCAAAGGVYQGDGTVCAAGTCPIGACCNSADGTCTALTSAGCSSAGGTYLGDGTVCGPTGCPGACCVGSSPACTIGTAADCALVPGGVYQGDSTTCSAAGGPNGVTRINTFIVSPPLVIPTVIATVSDTKFVAGPSEFISDIDVDLRINHTWVSDMAITLSHNGVSVLLIDRQGTCSTDNYGTGTPPCPVLPLILDDEGGGGPIETAACVNDLASPPNYVPNNPLSAFDGLDKSGYWTLTIADLAGGDGGALIQWSLHIEQAEALPECGCTTNGDCEDGDLCTDDVCDPLQGCLFPPVDCDDTDPCTADSCDPMVGCEYEDILGACCLVGNACMISTDCDCTAGTWQGPGSECDNFVSTGTFQDHVFSPALPIPDNNPAGAVDVRNIAGSGILVYDVDVDLVITHTWIGDLCVSLSHGGEEVLLLHEVGGTVGMPPAICGPTSGGGCSCNDLGTVAIPLLMNDEGAGGLLDLAASVGSCTTSASTCGLPANGPPGPTAGYIPLEALSAFDGMDKGGDWTIKVTDGFGADVGTLVQWSLHIEEGASVPKCGCADDTDCDDFDACTDNVCNALGLCEYPPAVLCDDSNDCTDDSCDPGTGLCVYTNDDSNTCDDGLFCTINDACSAGACTGDPRDCTSSDSIFIDFENPPYVLGTIEGQDGWSSDGAAGSGCAMYDHEVATNAYGYAEFDGQSLRMSNAVTSGCFGDQTFSKSLPNEVGETTATNGGMSGGTRRTNFAAEWSFASTVPGAQQVGLSVVASPDRGDGARMSWVQMTDTAGGLEVNFFDYQDLAPYGAVGSEADGCGGLDDFFLTTVATGLNRTVTHTIRIEMDILEGPLNDVVRVYVDGALGHTGTSWEDYFRWCEATGVSRTVDSVLFRTGGTAAPATDGFGFVIDNLTLISGLPGDVCNAGVCNETDDVCELAPANEGGACDDGLLCTENDTCQAGVCGGMPVICQDPVPPCEGGQTCDPSSGLCVDNPDATPGTPCGDLSDTDCDNPDTCDGSGGCQANNEPVTTECRPDAGECDVAENCDGMGNCPADGFELPGTPCGSASDTVCDNPDACDGAGSCQINNKPVTTECRPDAGECDVAENCDGTGNCPPDGFEPPGTPCGSASDTVCDNPDACNGAGSCQINNKPVTTECRPDAGECDVAENCDGTGNCPPDGFETPGTPCGSGSNTDCDDPDTCNGSGTCNNNNVPDDGTQCNDGNECTNDNSDQCMGGVCVGGPPVNCDDGDPCNGVETCVPPTGCMDGTPLDCDDNQVCTDDFCDASGCYYEQVDCDDGDECTIDTCVEPAGCASTPIGDCSTDADCPAGSSCVDCNCVSGTVEYPLDIREKKCPNKLKCNSSGTIKVYVVGTASLDVHDIDLDTLQICVCGTNDCVQPDKPPRIKDKVGPHFTQCGDCSCKKLKKDYIDDIEIKFKHLCDVLDPNLLEGSLVDWEVRGNRLNGTPIKAHDCTIIDRPGSGQP